MTAQTPLTPFSQEGLQALQETLSLHGEYAMIWRNPMTDQLDVKRIPFSDASQSSEDAAYWT